MHASVVAYEGNVKASGGTMAFAAVNHAPTEGGPPQGVNAGAVGAETAEYAILPQTGLSALSIGQSDVLLNYVPVSMRNIMDTTRPLEIDNPLTLASGTFDVAFLVIFLLPIFILAMTYDLLSSEKERGTLAMILAHPVSLRALMSSKLVARAAILMAVVLTLGLGVLLAVGSELGSADTWWRFALWIAVVLLYSFFWFALAVVVNIFGRSSATNGILLAGSWLVLVVIVPTLVSLLATTLHPPPSRMDLTIAMRDAQTIAEKERMKALDEYYYDHLELVPDGQNKARDFLTLALANSASIEKATQPLYRQFQAQLNRQEELVQKFQFLSPAIMMQLALNEISGSSADRYENFMRQVEAFHKQWGDYFALRFLKRDPLTSADYADFPRFTYVEEPFAQPLARMAPSLFGLLAIVFGVALYGFVDLRRYQVAAR
ncbi:MAG: ABC transporter permease subunit [Gammaproteobacteria bacterium]|nr:ABC transporter permease subunit [Gammaproteobacteria bacterium]